MNGPPVLMIRRPRCHWCAVLLVPHVSTIDHVHPLGLGGPDALCNVVPCCANCNKVRSKETAWLVGCTRALEEYWEALERGLTRGEASEYARCSNWGQRVSMRSSTILGAPPAESLTERLAS